VQILKEPKYHKRRVEMDKKKLAELIKKAKSPMVQKPLGECTKEEAIARCTKIARKLEEHINRNGGNKFYNIIDAFQTYYTDGDNQEHKTWDFLIKTTDKEGKLYVDIYKLYGWRLKATGTIPRALGKEPEAIVEI